MLKKIPKLLHISGGMLAVYALLPSIANAATIGVGAAGDVFAIDETTGVGTLLGPSGFSGLNSAASDSEGTIYSVAGREIITIDPITGAGTLVTTLDFGAVRGLAFSPDDILYAIFDGGFSGGLFLPDDLYTIDLSNGTPSLIGSTGSVGLQSLAFSPTGDLFSWDVSNVAGEEGLATLNLTTGAATFIDPNGPSVDTDIQALEFAPDGTLFGIRNSLFTIDPTTGVTTVVGSGGYSDVRGLAFATTSTSTPEPSTLLGLGALALASGTLLRRRRKN